MARLALFCTQHVLHVPPNLGSHITEKAVLILNLGMLQD
jgi:hypothetical protein